MSTQSLIVLQSLWCMEAHHSDEVKGSIEQNLTRIKKGDLIGSVLRYGIPHYASQIAHVAAGTGSEDGGMCCPNTTDDLKAARDACVSIYFQTHRYGTTTDPLFTLDPIDKVPEMHALAGVSQILVARQFGYPISGEEETRVRQVLDCT